MLPTEIRRESDREPEDQEDAACGHDGVRAAMTPDAVATPFPPRKPCQIGKAVAEERGEPREDGDRDRRRSGRIAEGPAQHDDRREALREVEAGR